MDRSVSAYSYPDDGGYNEGVVEHFGEPEPLGGKQHPNSPRGGCPSVLPEAVHRHATILAQSRG